MSDSLGGIFILYLSISARYSFIINRPETCDYILVILIMMANLLAAMLPMESDFSGIMRFATIQVLQRFNR
jgi:hypothetical protein